MGNKVFISHASRDYRDSNGKIIEGNAISQIIKVLDDNNIERWIDESGLVSAKGWCEQLKEAIDECNIVLFVSSHNANRSDNTANEISYAYEHKKHIIPLRLDCSPYHKAIELNLSRLHYLKFYEDKNKALRNLISTIKDIHTPIILNYNEIHIPLISDEKVINGEKPSLLIKDIFISQSIQKCYNSFKTLLKIYSCSSSDLNSYLEELLKIEGTLNSDVRRSMIVDIIADLTNKDYKFNRFELIIYYVFLMFLYHYINDHVMVKKIQEKIAGTKFKRTFIERNGDDINDIVDGTVKAALFVGSVAAMLTGKGSLGRAGAAGLKTNEKIKCVKGQTEIQQIEKDFEALKRLMLSIKFQ